MNVSIQQHKIVCSWKMFEPRLQVDILHKKKDLSEMKLKHSKCVVKRSFLTRFRESCNQYLLNTTLHGLKYIGDGKITRFER